MTKHVLSSLCTLMLLGCGAGAQPDSGAPDTVSAVEQAADVPGTHGYEIELPIWNLDYVPPEWETYEIDTLGRFIQPLSGARTATMDWRGGNATYNIIRSHTPNLDTLIEAGSGYEVVSHVTGFFSNTQPGLVRGSIYMEMESYVAHAPPDVYDTIQLALQVHDASGWHDAVVRNMYLTEYYYGEVEGTLPPNVPVRFEVRIRRATNSKRLIGIYHVRMFGAQCYPDFMNAGSCL